MSSNYKYKGKPLDEVAGCFDTNKIDNDFIDNVDTLKINTLGYDDGSSSNMLFIKSSNNIAGGLWGNSGDIYNDGKYLSLSNNGRPIEFADPKSILYNNVLNKNRESQSNKLSNNNTYYISYNKSKKYKEYKLSKNNSYTKLSDSESSLLFIELQGPGGDGYFGYSLSNDVPEDTRYHGGSGGSSGAFCALIRSI